MAHDEYQPIILKLEIRVKKKKKKRLDEYKPAPGVCGLLYGEAADIEEDPPGVIGL